tara:strand:- start:246 stop:437 length:192 start_codon:yes stop_codon:yes gene_type:complete
LFVPGKNKEGGKKIRSNMHFEDYRVEKEDKEERLISPLRQNRIKERRQRRERRREGKTDLKRE